MVSHFSSLRMQEGDHHNGLGLGTYVMILRGSVSSSLIPSQSGNETTNLDKFVCAIPLYIYSLELFTRFPQILCSMLILFFCFRKTSEFLFGENVMTTLELGCKSVCLLHFLGPWITKILFSKKLLF